MGVGTDRVTYIYKDSGNWATVATFEALADASGNALPPIADDNLRAFGESSAKGMDVTSMDNYLKSLFGDDYGNHFGNGTYSVVDKDNVLYANYGKNIYGFALSSPDQPSAGKATQLMQNIVKNHHDDEQLMKDAQDVFKGANRSNEGMKLISETRQEMVLLNNKGVGLLRDGNLDEAISLFETAAAALVSNKIINANAAYALVQCMSMRGKNDAMMKKAQFYLDRVHGIDPHYEQYHSIISQLQNLKEKKGA